VYVGIDVSKEQLDVASDDGAFSAKFTNDEEGHGQLTKQLLELGPELVVLESTGPYQVEVSLVFAAAKLPVVVVNPRPVRDFAKAVGVLAKTDKLDALVQSQANRRVGWCRTAQPRFGQERR
jgi:transposase